jgi:YVTN family beta-propeller protein
VIVARPYGIAVALVVLVLLLPTSICYSNGGGQAPRSPLDPISGSRAPVPSVDTQPARSSHLGPAVPSFDPFGPDYVSKTLVLVNGTTAPGNFLAASNAGPAGVTYDAATHELWASGGGGVSWSNRTSTKFLGDLVPHESTAAILLDAATGTIYAADYYGQNVTVINATTHLVIRQIGVGANPNGLAFDASRAELFVQDYGGSNVTVVNTTSNSVVANLTLPSGPTGIAFDPLSDSTYVSVFSSGVVEVVNDSTRAIVTTVALPTAYTYGAQPTGIAFDASNSTMLVGEYGPAAVAIVSASNASYQTTVDLSSVVNSICYDDATATVYVSTNAGIDLFTANMTANGSVRGLAGTLFFDPSTGDVFATGATRGFDRLNTTTETAGAFFATAGPSMLGIAYSNQTGLLYAAGWDQPVVTVVNMSNGSIAGSVGLPGASPFGALVDPLLGEVFVSDSGEFSSAGSNKVYVLNATAPYARLKTLTPGGGPEGMALTPDGRTLAVADSTSNALTLLNASSGTNETAVLTDSYPTGVTYAPAWGDFAVVNQVSATVEAINATLAKVVLAFPVCYYPGDVVYDPVLGFVFVSCPRDGLVIELNDSTSYPWEIRTLHLGASPTAMAFDAVTDQVFVANARSGNVSISDASTGLTSGSLAVGGNPVGLAVNPGNGDVYVANENVGSISVISPGRPIVFDVNFTEAGLGPGTNWSVALNYASRSSNMSSIVFVEPNGTYSFSIAPVPGYTASRVFGNLMVAGNSVTVAIQFSPTALYPIAFNETGLPPGTSWSVTFNAATNRSTTGSIGFSHVNGTGLAFEVAAVPGFVPTPTQGSLTVAGAAVTQGISFGRVPPGTYRIGFTETGLPPQTAWSVQLNGTFNSSTTASVGFSVVSGNYRYSIGGVPGFEASRWAGTVPVASSNVTVPLVWTPVTYPAWFNETGLTVGATWHLHLQQGNMYLNTTFTASSVTFPLANGTYEYVVAGPTYYTASPASGRFSVSGAAGSVLIEFTPQDGYLQGTASPPSVSLLVAGQPAIVSTGSYNVTEFPGTYTVEASAPGYLPLIANVSVAAGHVTWLNISLTPSPPTGEGPPGGSLSYVILVVGAAAVIVVAVAVAVVMRRRERPPTRDAEPAASD